MVEIEVCERIADPRTVWERNPDGKLIQIKRPNYHASIKGTGYWGQGRSPDEAIGDLLRSHPEKFNVHITILGGAHAR
jgi:hypothetical protein